MKTPKVLLIPALLMVALTENSHSAQRLESELQDTYVACMINELSLRVALVAAMVGKLQLTEKSNHLMGFCSDVKYPLTQAEAQLVDDGICPKPEELRDEVNRLTEQRVALMSPEMEAAFEEINRRGWSYYPCLERVDSSMSESR